MPERILIVEDEEHIAKGLQLNLDAEGFSTRIVGNGQKAIEEILRDSPDLVLLDVMLPGASGFEVCNAVRAKDNRTPILFLTARGSEDDRIKGLELGGDDYMTKPFSVRELLLRIRAILRRAEWYHQTTTPGNEICFGDSKVDFSAYKAQTRQG